MSSMVFLMSPKEKPLCAKFLNIHSDQRPYGRSVRTSSAAPPRASALSPELLSQTRSLLLQLCSQKYALEACNRAAAPVPREIAELPRRSLAILFKTQTVPKQKKETETELDSLFFALALTTKWLELSSLCCSLYEASQIRRPAGCLSNRVLHSPSFFDAIVYSPEEDTALQAFSGEFLDKARKAAMNIEENLARGQRTSRGSGPCSPLGCTSVLGDCKLTFILLVSGH